MIDSSISLNWPKWREGGIPRISFNLQYMGDLLKLSVLSDLELVDLIEKASVELNARLASAQLLRTS